jgi:uncharacterized membrane protein
MAFAGAGWCVGVALASTRAMPRTAKITLAGRELAIEHRCGIGVEARDFAPNGAREPARCDGSLVEVTGEGQRACVGRYLRPEWRTQLAQELRLALRLRD